VAALAGAAGVRGGAATRRPPPLTSRLPPDSSPPPPHTPTASSGGIGYQLCDALAGLGARVFLLSRDPTRGNEAAARLRRANPGARVDVLVCDLTYMGQIDAAAARFLAEVSGGAAGAAGARLDLLALNAGEFHPCPKTLTGDGLEVQHASNLYGHLLLCLRLLPTIIATPGRPRIVWTASEAEKFGPSAARCLRSPATRHPPSSRPLA